MLVQFDVELQELTGGKAIHNVLFFFSRFFELPDDMRVDAPVTNDLVGEGVHDRGGQAGQWTRKLLVQTSKYVFF